MHSDVTKDRLTGQMKEGRRMARAFFKGTLIAESETFQEIEGNVYFPPESIERQFFHDSSLHTHCAWKGQASYYSLNVDGQAIDDVAWYYPNPSPKAMQIKDHVAFYRSKDLTVEK